MYISLEPAQQTKSQERAARKSMEEILFVAFPSSGERNLAE
jgi:hypothetical protein